jgi:hypothetical protein
VAAGRPSGEPRQFEGIVCLLDFLETELIRTMRWPTDGEIGALAARDRALCLRVTSDHRRSTTTVALGMIGSPEADLPRFMAGH